MLHMRLVVPSQVADEVVTLLSEDDTVCNVVVLADAARDPRGHLVECDVARESASPLLEALRRLEVDRTGSISLDEGGLVMSDAAERAERLAPGRPVDAVIWDAIESQASEDSKMSWSFAAFLVLALLIAGVGRYLDQPILIVGAMVVGPEFAPISAICLGLARRRARLGAQAAATLLAGFAFATAVATLWWAVAYAFGWITSQQAATGRLTAFIVHPDIWSVVIAMLAGVAGVLSLTAAKSATLVGVFISVTTVPAAGTVALTLATGVWREAALSALQLGVNLLGMVVAGTATMLVQRLVWSRVTPPRPLHPLAGHAATPRPAQPGGSPAPR